MSNTTIEQNPLSGGVALPYGLCYTDRSNRNEVPLSWSREAGKGNTNGFTQTSCQPRQEVF